MCYGFGGPWSGGFSGGGFGGGIFMMLPMLLVWGLIIWAGVLLLRKFQSSNYNRVAVSGAALDILKERFAKGEISRDEFEQMKKDIQ